MSTETKFQDKSARVLLVDSSGAVRQLLSEVAKSVGFSNSQAVASIADAHNILETEGADWLIVPLSADQPINGLHTVRMVTSFPELKNVRVSLLLDEKELWCLPKAFESGLLSYHMKPFTKDSLTKDLEELLGLFGSYEWDGTRVSAEYLRRALKLSGSADDLLTLEKTLLDMFPGNPLQLLNLAHAQHISGQTDHAKATLKQASFIDAALSPAIDQKAQELFGSTDLTLSPEAQNAGGNALGLETVVIIDPDDAARATVKAIFVELGVPEIQDFADGETAWGCISETAEPSLIVMEWRIPQLTGPLLMQRIRAKGFQRCPMVVYSALIKPSDMPIVREMGVSNVINKPCEKDVFIKTIIWTVQQDRMPTEQQTLETKIRSMINIKNIGEAEALSARYFADASIVAGRKNVIRAELAYAKDMYEAARDFAIESLKGTAESIFALNVLGKALMVLRQFEAALKCFQKAQSLSPMNLERLVMIAESQAELGEAEAAAESVAKAKDIDPDSQAAKEGEARVASAGGSSDAARKMLGQIEGIGNVISYLNNKAVAHAKCGLTDEGLDLYRKTLDSIPDDKPDMKAIVTYNMALAKIRHNSLADALIDLDQVIAIPESKVSKKAASLKKRLEVATASNTSFALKEADQVTQVTVINPASPTQDESQAADATSIAAAFVETTRGDLCCYLVFKPIMEDTDSIKKLLATPPRFKLRKSIERVDRYASSDNKAS